VDRRPNGKSAARIERMKQEAARVRAWLKAHPNDRIGPTGGLRKSNLTDNESAKLATDKGVIQGYSGIAVVDAAHQVIVEAQAHGTGAEQALLFTALNARDSLAFDADRLRRLDEVRPESLTGFGESSRPVVTTTKGCGACKISKGAGQAFERGRPAF
jgi:hypothetical protein